MMSLLIEIRSRDQLSRVVDVVLCWLLVVGRRSSIEEGRGQQKVVVFAYSLAPFISFACGGLLSELRGGGKGASMT